MALKCGAMQTKLQQLRQKRGLGRLHLAFIARVSERTIYNIEEGSDRPVSPKVRAKLAGALGVRETVLFTKENKIKAVAK